MHILASFIIATLAATTGIPAERLKNQETEPSDLKSSGEFRKDG
jgi:hypothetical protein